MKTLSVTLAIACCLFLGFISAETPKSSTSALLQQETENIGFKWAFGALVGKDKKFVSITRDTTLSTGDEIKMFVELTKDCFVYVIHAGPKGEINLYFPYNLKDLNTGYKVETNYYLPKGRQWDQFDSVTGRETFYLLAATERLVELEALLSDYMSADKSKKPAISEQIITEIRNVKRKFKTFTTLAEKPITIGGNVRSLEKAEEAKRPDVSTIAIKISANNFYSKTITIDHR
jgi:hypothetical protein